MIENLTGRNTCQVPSTACMPVPDLSVVIVSFQVRDLLDCCVSSIHNCVSALNLEIIVVDNASTDGTPEWLRRYYPQVQVVPNTENLGFSKANNQGLKLARGRYLMLLNPDTVVPTTRPCAMDKLVGFMESHPYAGACGPILRYPDGSLQHSAFRFPTLSQVYFDLFPVNWRLLGSSLNGRYRTALYEKGQPFQVDHPLGAAFLVRREAVERVGWLDEDFFMYSEEIDWALRLRHEGWGIWCVPDAEIIHYEAQSTRQFRDAMFVELWKARMHLFRKHYSAGFNLAAALLLRAGMRRAAKIAQEAYAHGKISDSELQRRLSAYREVERMSRASN